MPEEYRVLSFPAPEVLRDSANIPPPVQPETEPQKVIPIILNGKDSAERMKEITDRLETGIQQLFDSDRYKAYLTTMAKFHNYSFNNTLLIAMPVSYTHLVGLAVQGKINTECGLVVPAARVAVLFPVRVLGGVQFFKDVIRHGQRHGFAVLQLVAFTPQNLSLIHI